MNRRDFLKLTTAALAAAALPIPTLIDSPEMRAMRFKRMPVQRMDYGRRIGLGVEYQVAGVKKRRAMLFMGRDWAELDDDQREELWTTLERAVAEIEEQRKRGTPFLERLDELDHDEDVRP